MVEKQSFDFEQEAQSVQKSQVQPPIQNPYGAYTPEMQRNYSEFYSRFENPIGVIFISILNIIVGFLSFLTGITILVMYLMQSPFMQNRAWGYQILSTDPAIILLQYGGLSIVGAFICTLGIFMLLKKNWARITEIVLSILGVILSLILVVVAIMNKKIPALMVFFISFGLTLFITLYLTIKNNVKIAFTYLRHNANYQRFSS